MVGSICNTSAMHRLGLQGNESDKSGLAIAVTSLIVKEIFICWNNQGIMTSFLSNKHSFRLHLYPAPSQGALHRHFHQQWSSIAMYDQAGPAIGGRNTCSLHPTGRESEAFASSFSITNNRCLIVKVYQCHCNLDTIQAFTGPDLWQSKNSSLN